MVGDGSRDTALYSSSISRLSIGIDANTSEREINQHNANRIIDTQSAALLLGVDLTKWLTLFGTAGAAQFEYKGGSEYGDSTLKWSGGLQANLWRTDILDPEFMAGTLMLKSVIEYSQYNFDSNNYSDKPKWNDFVAELPISYEIYTEREDDLAQTPYSLALSLGPAVSLIKGTTMGNGSFSEKQSIGVMGAVDVYLAHNLSIGAYIQHFDRSSVGGNLIYHF